MKLFKMLLFVTIVLLSANLFAQYPVSKQAKIIEMSSASEALMEATGIYNGKGKGFRAEAKMKKDVTKNGVAGAIADAKRAAIYFLLFNGTDPLISNDDEKKKFDSYVDFFFDLNKISEYISFEETKIVKKIKISQGKGLKITKRFKVNVQLLKNDLTKKDIIQSMQSLSESIGTPFIMVIPASQENSNPISILKNDPKAKHAAAVVESFLTSQKYDVVVPEQQASLENLNKAQFGLAGKEEDYAYELALSIGSDVYITFSGAVEDAGYGTQKYAMSVRAFETTTARLLGTETGYSQGRKGEIMVSIEEAMNGAISNVLSRINNYWKDDAQKGIQYKVITNISTDFDEDEIEEVQFGFLEASENISKKSKNNITTNQTIDNIIWCDAQKYNQSMKFYMAIKKAYKATGAPGKLKKININRKLILLSIESE